MSNAYRFDGKVVVVTGAGNGLGRAHALGFAKAGAKVVVNDLGGSHRGEGQSPAAADQVVADIRAAGGEAVANYDSVEAGERIVQAALDAFGRIDVLVNNAGILRDVSFAKLTAEDWELVYRVHVLGALKTTQAAWPHFRAQKSGRVLFTTSAAGLYGNFGQANYAAAKMALVGLANTLAIEGEKNNIRVNTIAPIAGSRLTETVLPSDLIAALKPELVTPLVLRLCHDSFTETGGLYEVGGGFFAKVRLERARGKTFRLGRTVTPADLERAWPDIAGFADASHPTNLMESMGPVLENVASGPSKGGNELIDADLALGYVYPDQPARYDERDVALYALGIGAAKDPLDERDLRYVYELHGSGMLAAPTYGVIPAINTILQFARDGIQAPGLNYGLDRLLHGEQYLELFRPLPVKATLTNRARVRDIFDKGKGALVIFEVMSHAETGEPLFKNDLTMFIRGAGGFGGERGPSVDINVPPAREPDAVVEDAIQPNQALLYRLSGDWNPLHVDPDLARAFGFARPILHGLCTLGHAGRQVIRQFAPGGDPRRFRSIKVRFADPVIPGETLQTEMWRESEFRIVFRCTVKERQRPVITNAAVEFFTELPER